MGLFGFGSKGKSGGLMNVIRCDEQEYLVWKWRPEGQEANSTSRENAIRYGSSLRVKEGEVAVFVYKQKGNGVMQDFIVGPYDDTIKTANFPILTGIVGLAFGGESPFQAEVYFINLAGIIQVKFAVPYFDVYDPRFLDFAVPMAARGSITFQLEDYQAFIKLHRLIDFDLEAFKNQIKDAVKKYVKGFITNVPSDNQIPVLQIERKVMEISDLIQQKLAPAFIEDFGVKLKRFDLSAIEPDKESDGYEELRHLTAGQQAKTIEAQTDINIKNMQDTQRINAENMEETMRIQREESQRAQRLQTETNFIGAHTINQQAEVLKTGAQSLGQMGKHGYGRKRQYESGWHDDRHGYGRCHGTANGRYDEPDGQCHEWSDEYTTTSTKRAIPCFCEWSTSRSFQYEPATADGATRTTHTSDIRMETRHGRMGIGKQCA